jgi:hypothetical protein
MSDSGAEQRGEAPVARPIEVTQRGVGKESGIEVEMGIVYMLEIEGGMAARVHLYADRGQALAAAEAGEQG